MRVIRAIETCENQLFMNYPPLIIAYMGYKIVIDKTSDTAIKFYKNVLDNIPVNYLILQISPTMLTFTSLSTSTQEATTSSAQYLVQERWGCLLFGGK